MASRQLVSWLADTRVSLAFTTYEADRLILIGAQPDGAMSVFSREFRRPMAVYGHGRQLYLATLYQLWRFDDVPTAGTVYQGYDRLLTPRLAWITGDIDIHDIAVGADGEPLFVATLFGCLGRPMAGFSFAPLWRPPFLSDLVPEDRCHLNGVAMRDGRPAYATAISRSDVADGWRDRKRDGGVVIDVATGSVVLEGLSMPHSPRWHDGRLWLIESGTGWLGHADLERGRFEHVAFLPGYGRGLRFHAGRAIVGLSRPRHGPTFSDLPLQEALVARDAEPRCGVWLVDLASGAAVDWVRVGGGISELYDVAVLPGVTRPALIGLKSDEIRRVLTVGPPFSP